MTLITIDSRLFNNSPVTVNGKTTRLPLDTQFDASDDVIEALKNANVPFTIAGADADPAGTVRILRTRGNGPFVTVAVNGVSRRLRTGVALTLDAATLEVLTSAGIPTRTGTGGTPAPSPTPTPTPAPSFPVNPSISPLSGTTGQTFTAIDGQVVDGSFTSRRWLLSGTAIGTGTTVISASPGTLVLENTASGAGGTTVATSDPVTITVPAPVNTALPTITGTAQEGQTLSVSNGAWSNSPTSYTYQWKRGGVAIGGSVNSSRVLTAADVGAVITCTVTAMNAGGSASATSAGTSAVVAASTPVPVNTVAPAISGATTTSSTLSTTNGTWDNSPSSYAYQWRRDGVDISGATASTYVLTSADQSKSITCRVFATNAGGTAGATSNALAIPAAVIPLRAVATRGEGPVNIGPAITTSTQLRKIARTRHYIGGQPVSEIRLAFANWAATASGEALPGNTCEIQASIEFPGGATAVARVTFSGLNAYTMADGETVISDALLPSAFGLSSFPANTQFWVRNARTIASGGKICRHETAASPAITGESSVQCSATDDPLLDTTGALPTSATYTTYTEPQKPAAILGKTATAQVSVADIGDSIAYRSNDTAGDGQNGAGGWFQRGLVSVGGNHVPYIRLACPSERATSFVTAGSRRAALLAYVTHVECNYGTNDIGAARTAAQVLADLQSIWATVKSKGVQRLEQVLLIPRTGSTDSWATEVNQTYNAGFLPSGTATDTRRKDVNDAIIAGVGSNGLDAYLDLHTGILTGADPYKWVSNGTAFFATKDGTHPEPAKHGEMAIAFAARVATWTAQ